MSTSLSKEEKKNGKDINFYLERNKLHNIFPSKEKPPRLRPQPSPAEETFDEVTHLSDGYSEVTNNKK